MIIKLRKIEPKDSKLFLKWWKDEELIRLTSGVKESSDQVLLGYFNQLIKSPKDNHFIILLREKAIGHIALSHKNKSTTEIHIVIGEKKYQGKGFGSEAIKKAIEFASNEAGYENIVLEVRPDNIRAIRAYEKSGFIKIRLKKYSNTNQPTTLLMRLDKKHEDS